VLECQIGLLFFPPHSNGPDLCVERTIPAPSLFPLTCQKARPVFASEMEKDFHPPRLSGFLFLSMEWAVPLARPTWVISPTAPSRFVSTRFWENPSAYFSSPLFFLQVVASLFNLTLRWSVSLLGAKASEVFKRFLPLTGCRQSFCRPVTRDAFSLPLVTVQIPPSNMTRLPSKPDVLPEVPFSFVEYERQMLF